MPVLDPIVGTNGKILAVRVLRPGSNYLPQGKVFAWVNGGGGSDAALDVDVAPDGSIANVTVSSGGKEYTSKPSVQLTSKPPPYPPNPDPVFQDNPKGVPSWFNAVVESGSLTGNFIKLQPNNPANAFAPYYAGAESQATTFSTPAAVTFLAPAAFATHNSAALWLASPAPTKTLVEQVLYSSVISQYFTLSTEGVAPFNGAYLGDVRSGWLRVGRTAGGRRAIHRGHLQHAAEVPNRPTIDSQPLRGECRRNALFCQWQQDLEFSGPKGQQPLCITDGGPENFRAKYATGDFAFVC